MNIQRIIDVFNCPGVKSLLPLDNKRLRKFHRCFVDEIREEREFGDEFLTTNLSWANKTYKDNTLKEQFMSLVGDIFVLLDDIAEENAEDDIELVADGMEIKYKKSNDKSIWFRRYILPQRLSFSFFHINGAQIRMLSFNGKEHQDCFVYSESGENGNDNLFFKNGRTIKERTYWFLGGLYVSYATYDSIQKISNMQLYNKTVQYGKNTFRGELSNSNFKFIHKKIDALIKKSEVG